MAVRLHEILSNVFANEFGTKPQKAVESINKKKWKTYLKLGFLSKLSLGFVVPGLSCLFSKNEPKKKLLFLEEQPYWSEGSLRFRVQLRTVSAVACCPICPGPYLLTVWGYIWPLAQVSQPEYWQEEREWCGSPGEQKVAVTFFT